MTKKASKSIVPVPASRAGYLDSLLDPLGSMAGWTSQKTAEADLELLAHNAIGMRNHSLWWNYIYLYEHYTQKYQPNSDRRNALPGFPDMDTAIKVGAPSVYNWYYKHQQLPTTPWEDVPFVDLSLVAHAGFLSKDESRDFLAKALATWNSNASPDARRQTAAPFWLLASAWGNTPEWGSLLNMLHGPVAQGQPAGISVLDRKVADPTLLWQWQCLDQKDIGFLPEVEASKALDTLRLGSLSDTLRTRCETHFLSYFPQCKKQAEIAFALGAPLWVPPMDTLDGPLRGDVFEATPEALHPK